MDFKYYEFDIDNFNIWMLREMDKQKLLFQAKSDQYSTHDPLANFRTSALATYHEGSYRYMFEEAKGFAKKHIAHLINSNIDGPKLSESLGDIAVYCLIMKYMVEMHQENKS